MSSLILLYWGIILLMLVGVVGAVVPGIPGSSLILVGAIIWGLVQGFSTMLWPLGVVILVFILNTGIEFLSTYWGARRVGASSWSQIGAIVGMVIGVLGLLPALPFGGPLLGLLLGPVLGAFVGEFLYRRELQLSARTVQSAKASLGVVVGSLIGNVLEGLLALGSVIFFIFTTWPSVYGG